MFNMFNFELFAILVTYQTKSKVNLHFHLGCIGFYFIGKS